MMTVAATLVPTSLLEQDLSPIHRNKHKLNTKSSTESKLVTMYDKLGDILWTRHFLEAQGYTIV